MSDPIIEKLNNIETMLKEYHTQKKEVLSFDEACNYLKISPSTLYKHTSKNNIKFFRPAGKKIYFKKADLDSWLLSNEVTSNQEIEKEACNYILTKRRVK